MPPLKQQAKSTLCHRNRKHHVLIFMVAFFTVWLFVSLWVLYGHSSWKESISLSSTTTTRSTTKTTEETVDWNAEGAPPVIGIHEIVTVTSEEDHHHQQQQQQQQRSTEIVYAIAKNHHHHHQVLLQVALLLHGCSHSALKFFSPSSSCSTCIGLSEELHIARILLQEPSIAAVIAVTSQDRTSGCWSPQKDSPHVVDALQHVIAKLQQQQQQHDYNHQQQSASSSSTTPLLVKVWAFGASSGGRFAAQLAIHGIVDAAMVGVMNLGTDLVRKWNNMPTSQRPPIYLAPMPRDQRTLKGNQQDYANMMTTNQQQQQNNQNHNAGDASARVILDTETCTSFPVSARYLHQRVPHMTLDMAMNIVSQLQNHQHLDSVTNMLLQDPTQSDWRNVLLTTCGGAVDTNNNNNQGGGCLQNQVLEPGISPLAKALHRAWAFHEYCSEVTLPALHYFQQQQQIIVD